MSIHIPAVHRYFLKFCNSFLARYTVASIIIIIIIINGFDTHLKSICYKLKLIRYKLKSLRSKSKLEKYTNEIGYLPIEYDSNRSKECCFRSQIHPKRRKRLSGGFSFRSLSEFYISQSFILMPTHN